MTAYQLFIMIRENLGIGALGLIIILSFIEISKIKINPWSWIYNMLNKELHAKLDEQSKQIDKLSTKISEVEKETNENAAMSSRYRILRFDDEIRHKVLHIKD